MRSGFGTFDRVRISLAVTVAVAVGIGLENRLGDWGWSWAGVRSELRRVAMTKPVEPGWGHSLVTWAVTWEDLEALCEVEID